MTNNKKSSHITQAVYLVILAMIAYAVQLFFNVFLSRHLAPGLYGDFIVGLKTFMLMSSILLLGTETASKNFLSLYLKQERHHEMQGYISWNFRLLIITSSMFLLALCFLLLSLVFLHLYNVKDIGTYHFAIYLLFFSPLGALVILIASYLQSNNNIYWANFLQNASRYIFIIGLLFPAIYYFDIAVNSNSLVSTVVIAFILLVLAETIILMLKVPHISLKKTLKPKIQHKKKKKIWKKTALKLIINQLFRLVLSTLDIYLVEIFSNNEFDVDKYAAVLATASVIWIITRALYSFITPMVSYHFNYNKGLLQRAINSAVICNLIANAIMLPLLIIFVQNILHFFGESYLGSDTFWCFVILASGFSIGSFCRAALLTISYTGGYENHLIYAAILEFFVFLIAGIILTIFFGIIGTAIASTAAIIINTCYLIFIARSKLKIKTLIII